MHKEGARISNELPRIRAVKLVQAQRDALVDATAAAAHWSDVRDAATTMKLELARCLIDARVLRLHDYELQVC
eukprot:COSAG01_NODE_875_length_12972_cov_61.925503_15_plen_73_part_00